jgi:hypothetical protein
MRKALAVYELFGILALFAALYLIISVYVQANQEGIKTGVYLACENTNKVGENLFETVMLIVLLPGSFIALAHYALILTKSLTARPEPNIPIQGRPIQ